MVVCCETCRRLALGIANVIVCVAINRLACVGFERHVGGCVNCRHDLEAYPQC